MADRGGPAGIPRLGRARGGALTNARLFVAIGIAAAAAGTALWLVSRQAASPPADAGATPAIAPATILATQFTDPAGQPATLARFQGRLVVVNFWATWCGPCRAEMPAFNRLHERWAARHVQFVGISAEPSELAARFGRELGIAYPLWTGGDQVQDLSRRLGNVRSVLPHTVLLGPGGQVLEQRVGPYTEEELERRLEAFSPNAS